jgi:ankyrin repeat protein
VNQEDKFKMTPILLCCFKNLEIDPTDQTEEHKVNNRLQCIEGLYRRNADLNQMNPRTLWSPIFWCAYYGDAESVKFILDNHGICFEPDSKGLYPLDYAGNRGHREVSRIMVEYLVSLLDEFQRYLNNELFCGNDDAKHIFY